MTAAYGPGRCPGCKPDVQGSFAGDLSTKDTKKHEEKNRSVRIRFMRISASALLGCRLGCCFLRVLRGENSAAQPGQLGLERRRVGPVPATAGEVGVAR